MKEQYQAICHYRNGQKNPVYDGYTTLFKTEGEARNAIKKNIERIGKPLVVGGIGITYEPLKEFDVIKYTIRKRTVTPWETVGEIEVDPK